MSYCKEVDFTGTSVNVVRFKDLNISKKHRVLSIDHAVGSLIKRNEMYKSLFEGNLGRYACTSSKKFGFRKNPLGVDAEAVAAISKILVKILGSMGYFLSGWHLYDAGEGHFVMSWSACDDSFYEVDSNHLVYNPKAGELDEVEPFFGDTIEPYKTIKENLPKILSSLKKVSVPIDLFEVCIADEPSSEEGQNSPDGTYMKEGKVGSEANSKYILSGISIVSQKNGFVSLPQLGGRYAFLVVQ